MMQMLISELQLMHFSNKIYCVGCVYGTEVRGPPIPLVSIGIFLTWKCIFKTVQSLNVSRLHKNIKLRDEQLSPLYYPYPHCNMPPW